MIGRSLADFPRLVERHFAFLPSSGFRATKTEPTLVRFERNGVLANVYHGRNSCELGFEIERGGRRYGIGTILEAAGAPEAPQYRHWVATTADAIDAGLARLSALVETYAQDALRGDPAAFDGLERQRQASASAYAMTVLASQVRPRAEAAFREERYAEAAALYAEIQEALSAAELKKLDVARRRSGS